MSYQLWTSLSVSGKDALTGEGDFRDPQEVSRKRSYKPFSSWRIGPPLPVAWIS